MSAQDNIVCSKLESFAVPNISVGELLKNKISEIIQNEPNRKALVKGFLNFIFIKSFLNLISD